MKAFTNAQERDAGEWAALFSKADSRFKLLDVKLPLGSKHAIIQAEWQPDV